jgi:hypothetical protein
LAAFGSRLGLRIAVHLCIYREHYSGEYFGRGMKRERQFWISRVGSERKEERKRG